MTGGTDLDALLAGMRPTLAPETYVFATRPDGTWPDTLRPRMIFHEAEGTTLVITRSEAEAAGLDHEFPCRMITLDIHSALHAVGFIARIATELAAHGMGVNPVAGFFHDHLFVPEDRAGDAMAILENLSREG
ncbi:ACT domain-containing protein [Roseovarius sp. SCSIO 43702]|uniref:ACT domain-containing protein n=1 Tax=Roseovarius sp. SCSIO 43702 TaxID=2823043 RepID=UPI001C73D7C5|nr:ACT domain-containing protein [Roseovarius sp. SCSIO 43702]QYX56077.1 ACT domain-containing protein [Roseovarius sp. SCSIO 43702]